MVLCIDLLLELENVKDIAHITKRFYKCIFQGPLYPPSFYILYFLLHTEDQTYKSGDFCQNFPSLQAIENLQNHLHFKKI